MGMLTGARRLLLLFILLFSAILSPGGCGLSFAQECCSQDAANLEEIRSSTPEAVLEEELLALTNEHRIRRGLPPLILDFKLAQIARQHSEGMAIQGFISHSLPSGDLRLRMARAGYSHEVARENVATAPSIINAQNALTRSPKHEDNILAKDVDRVGIGIARCPLPYGRQLYITEIFARPREEYRAEMVEETLVSRVEELRRNGAGAMFPDPILDQLASRSLHSINVPYRKEELQKALMASTLELPEIEKRALSRVQANVQLLHNPKNLSLPNNAQDGQARAYGSAIRQVTDDQNQSAFLVLTLIGISR